MSPNRDLMAQHNLDKVIFQSITGKLSNAFGADTTKQRLDSVHIKSNMQKLGRIRIFSETIHGFLANLKRNHESYFATVDGVSCADHGDEFGRYKRNRSEPDF